MSNIAFFIYIYRYLSIYLYLSIYIYISHIFIHSSVGGHLVCYHSFAVVNNAAVNIGVHISFLTSAFVFFG